MTHPSPYPAEALLQPGSPRVYRGPELDNLAFPLGGIGTGAIALGGWGQLRDFEIFNRPHKGLQFNHTFFSLFAQAEGGPPLLRLLQGPAGGAFFDASGTGLPPQTGGGLPRFEAVTFTGQFPLARLDFADTQMPLTVALEAFNPFIPLNPDDSSLPIAMFVVQLANPGPAPVRATLFANLENKLGFPDIGGGVNEYFEASGVRGIRFSTTKHGPDSPRYGTLALATPHTDLNVQTHWFRGRWFDGMHRFLDEAQTGELTERREPARDWQRPEAGTLGLRVSLDPGQSARLPIWIVWHIPNFEMYWSKQDPKPVWLNHYATRFADAVAVAEYVAGSEQRLEAETRRFTDALFSSTLPAAVLDAVSSQISILKTNTCLRLTDGTFYGWEGCAAEAGCCEGSCTHVWNYAQALPYLFPSLERSMRNAEYAYTQQPDGHMTFRLPLPLGTPGDGAFFAAADGQLGGIIKVYREWQVCGDDDWLRDLWPGVRRALEYAWRFWDQDRDGVMEGVQHNTYDIEFYGPNAMLGSCYLGALRAAEEMARHLGDVEAATTYRAIFESGRSKMDQALFNGEFYVQDIRLEAAERASHDLSVSYGGFALDPADPRYPKYQAGQACMSDQLIGQWLARTVRLGDVFDPAHIRQTLQSIFRYNWRRTLTRHANPQRIYALHDEAGLLIATWPRGERPGLPFVYADEVWCGIEYQVASHLIYEGYLLEGLSIVKGARDRYTGVRRNPWDELECGHHYARSMASYALLLALSDFGYSAPRQALRFAPQVYADDFTCFFSVETGWGLLKQQRSAAGQSAAVEVLGGALTLRELTVALAFAQPSAALAGQAVPAAANLVAEGQTTLTFDPPTTIHAGQALRITEARAAGQAG